MSNILGLDFGTKNIGFAIGNELTNSSSTFDSFSFRSRQELFNKIEEIINEWAISRIILGLPLNMDGTESDMSKLTRDLQKDLLQKFKIKCDLIDERLTSYEAKEILKREGQKKTDIIKNNHGLAAKLILDSWLREDKK
tara:strand:- start:1438 stop:1854 length:417 start_codon:yes stop_codon:yes gene_type:complete